MPMESTLPLRSVLDKRSTFHSGRCWTRATGMQQPSSYLGVIKCTDTGSSKLAPAPAHLIAFIVNFHAALGAAPLRMKARWFRACGTPRSAAGMSTFHSGRR